MKELEWARWSTPQEIESLNNYFKAKQQSNGLEWLSNNSKEVIERYYQWCIDYKESKINTEFKKHNAYLSKIEKDNELFFKYYHSIKAGVNYQCLCKGNLKVVRSIFGEFIGCDNYLEKVEHTKVYHNRFEREFKSYFEWPKQYLSIFIKECYPDKNIKASNLYEFLKINDIELMTDIDEGLFYDLSKRNKNSKDRELLVKGVLEKIFTKVGHQVHITCKYKNERQKIKKPDFICVGNESIYIFEQKKSIDNCDETQLDEYVYLLSHILPNKIVRGYFIVELGNENELPYNCFTLKKLQNEFN